MPRPVPAPLSLALTFLRSTKGLSQKDLAAAVGLRASVVSEYEKGIHRGLNREKLRDLAAAMGYGTEAIDLALLAVEALSSALDTPRPPAAARAAEAHRVRQFSFRLGLMVAGLAEAHLPGLLRARRARQDRLHSAQLWGRLAHLSAAERRYQVERMAEFQTWSFGEWLCAESGRAAADDAARALDLAKLALRVAELAPGELDWRSLLQGYCWGFIGNSRRVGGDLPGAEAAFVRAWKLWHAGAAADTGLLGQWRLLDLEASLRRAQRQFSKALELLDRARAAAPTSEVGRILLNKSFVLEQAGEIQGALSALREAAPLIEQSADRRLRRALRFNWIVNLCHLGRYAEAEARFPELRDLTMKVGSELDLLRVRWLSGRLAAGLGRREEARTTLDQVRQELASHGNGYDVALVSLELAVLDLEQGRASEVSRLAAEMVWIFSAQGVHREALAALRIFCQAAETGRVTAALARRLLGYLEHARHDPGLRFGNLA